MTKGSRQKTYNQSVRKFTCDNKNVKTDSLVNWCLIENPLERTPPSHRTNILYSSLNDVSTLPSWQLTLLSSIQGMLV